MTISPAQLERIRRAWKQALPPLQVASELRLSPTSVIREYVRLDSLIAQ